MSRMLRRGMGAALCLAVVSLAVVHGVAVAAGPGTAQRVEPQATETPIATCDAGDVCVFSQDGKQKLVFDQPTGQMPDLFRYTPGPGPTGSWANGVYRMINRTSVPVQLQDIDNHPPTIIGAVPPGQNVAVPELPLNQADRLLIIEPVPS